MPFLPRPGSFLVRQFVPIIEQCATSIGTESIWDFGPEFLPTLSGLSVSRWTGPESHHAEALPLAVSCFPLSKLDSSTLSVQLEAMHKAAPFILLADFKVAERNIELPASLLMRGVMGMGASSQGCFKEYGGLEGLLYAERKHFAVRERHSLLGGALACIFAEWLC